MGGVFACVFHCLLCIGCVGVMCVGWRLRWDIFLWCLDQSCGLLLGRQGMET